MDFVIDQLKLLGLNSREMRVFTTLATFGRMNMTTIARRAQLPRTTVDAIVRRLRVQGLLEKHLIKNHHEWSVDLEEVTKNLSNLESKLFPKVTRETSQQKIEGEADVKTQSNLENMITDCDALLKEHAGEEVLILQGSVTDACAREEAYFEDFYDLDSLRQMSIQSIASRSILRLFARREINPLRRFDGLNIRMTLVPDARMQTDSDILIFLDRALILNIEDKTMAYIEDEQAVGALRNLFMLAQGAGEKIDLHYYIRGLIEEREKA